MDKHLNNGHNEVLWNLLVNPADKGRLHASELQQLVNEFPQSGLLHALLSHADSQQTVSHAAAYLNPKTLYVLVNSPEILAEVSDKQIVQQLGDGLNYAVAEEETHHSENSIVETNHESIADTIEEAPIEVAGIDHHENNRVEAEPVHDERAEVEHHPRAESEDVTEPSAYKPEVTENTWDEEVVGEPVPDEHEHQETKADVELPVSEAEVIPQHEPAIIDVNDSEYEIISEDIAEDTLPGENTGPHTEHEIAAVSHTEEREPELNTHNVHKDELLTETPSFQLSEQPHSIDDEVFDEITGIENINFVRSSKPSDLAPPPAEAPVVDEEELPSVANEPAVTEPVAKKERALNMDDEAEKLIIGNIAATDYFVFDRAFTERKQPEPVEKESSSEESANTGMIVADDNRNVSKYDDDTMPYTFMWWLNKTRREHAGIYQPFKLDTSQAIRQQGADELQQQYYENIFHLSSVEELDRSTSHPTVEFDPKRKEDRIIKKFITEEPHIRTPSSDKLDTENKARKSSEDHDELVTETLAHIYADQMLYHKAINTYKKLMLKFPEKSRYFADQIEQLERKTN